MYTVDMTNGRSRCFCGTPTQEAFSARSAEVKKEISGLPAQKMDQTDREAWIDFFCSKYEIDCLELYPEAREFDLSEKTVRVCNQWARFDPHAQKHFDKPGVRATCRVPYAGDPDLFKLRPSTFSLSDSFECERIDRPNRDGVGYLHLACEMAQDGASPEAIRSHFDGKLDAFAQEAARVNADAQKFNATLRETVEKAIDLRIAQLDNLAQIRRGLDLPLNRADGAPMALPIPLKKKRLVFGEPKPSTQGNTYSIPDRDYDYITEVLDSLCATMEATPGSYSSFTEEQLRDHLLGVLNTHYENATGETFRNHGKTDIHIPFEDHAAYIAECKCWHGRKKFLDAIDQLFSYTTWRDTKVSLIVFNKATKRYESVLEAVDRALKDIATRVDRVKPAQWSCAIQNEQDERVMHVRVQVFNLYYS